MTEKTATDALDLVAWFIQNQEAALADASHDKSKSITENIQEATKEHGKQTERGRAVTIRQLKRCGVTEERAKALAQASPELYAIDKLSTGGRPSPCLSCSMLRGFWHFWRFCLLAFAKNKGAD